MRARGVAPIIPIVLAGGKGARLWPVSQDNLPKQFLKLTSQHSMLQETLRLIDNDGFFTDPIITCHEEYRFLAAEQSRELNIKPNRIILEPSSKNTGPAIITALHYVKEHFPENSTVLILPSDHYITDQLAFYTAISRGRNLATDCNIVTFGIKPTKPETGYGYIHCGEWTKQSTTFHVNEFIEKPDFATAERFLASEEYLWNSGIFMCQPNTLLNAMLSIDKKLVDNAKNPLKTA